MIKYNIVVCCYDKMLVNVAAHVLLQTIIQKCGCIRSSWLGVCVCVCMVCVCVVCVWVCVVCVGVCVCGVCVCGVCVCGNGF